MKSSLLLFWGSVAFYLTIFLTIRVTKRVEIVDKYFKKVPNYLLYIIELLGALMLAFITYIIIPDKTKTATSTDSIKVNQSTVLPDSSNKHRLDTTNSAYPNPDKAINDRRRHKELPKQLNISKKDSPTQLPDKVQNKPNYSPTKPVFLDSANGSQKFIEKIYKLEIHKQGNVVGWTNSKIKIEENDSIVITSGGSINVGPVYNMLHGLSTPAGLKGLENRQYNLFVGFPHAALFASLDNINWVYCGMILKYIAPKSGDLIFNINDNKTYDNSGFYVVDINVYRKTRN